MRWRGRRVSDNVVDRRGSRPSPRPGGLRLGGLNLPSGGTGGRLGLGGVVLIAGVLLVLWLSNGDLGSLFSPEPSDVAGAPPADDDRATFAGVVLADTEDVWSEIFARSGTDYREPTMVLFSGGTSSACGYATDALGPFYCPADQRVFLDLDFFDELSRRHAAPGDFAAAYVIAHEVGHHVQNLIGTLNGPGRAAGGDDANFQSILVELQADCFAGVWAYFANAAGVLEAGDLEEALNAAAQIGDDAIQQREQGYIVPESFNHGTSEQRARWFRRGFISGDPNACDTFNADTL